MRHVERCRELVEIDTRVSTLSSPTATSVHVKDGRQCRMREGHRGKHRFFLALVRGGKVVQASVTWI